jgi:hypothetical protein
MKRLQQEQLTKDMTVAEIKLPSDITLVDALLLSNLQQNAANLQQNIEIIQLKLKLVSIEIENASKQMRNRYNLGESDQIDLQSLKIIRAGV